MEREATSHSLGKGGDGGGRVWQQLLQSWLPGSWWLDSCLGILGAEV